MEEGLNRNKSSGKKSKKREKRMRRQRRMKRIMHFIKVMCIILAILALLIGGGYLIVTKVFAMKNISFTGNTWNTNEELKSYLFKTKYDSNTIVFWAKDKYKKKVQIPYVETYKVKIKWPTDVVITVYEKKIMGYVATSDGNMYFDKDGIIVDQSEEVLENVPKLSGVNYENAVLYGTMKMPSDVVLKSVTEIKQQLDKNNTKVDEIVFDDKFNITLIDGKKKIKFGEAKYLTEKVYEYSELKKQNDLSGYKGTFHLENCKETAESIPFTPD